MQNHSDSDFASIGLVPIFPYLLELGPRETFSVDKNLKQK